MADINNIIADISASAQTTRNRLIEKAQRKRQSSQDREDSINKHLAEIPKEVQAREGNLLPSNIRHTRQDMSISVLLSNPSIKIVVFDNYIHLGTATYAIDSVVRVRLNKKAALNDLKAEIEGKFKEKVSKIVNKINDYANEALAQVRVQLGNELDNIIIEKVPPISFKFTSRTILCSRWLNAAATADRSLGILLKLAHIGVISESDYEKYQTTLYKALSGFAKYIYELRTKIFTAFYATSQVDKETSDEFNKIKEEAAQDGLIINEKGEVTEKEDNQKEEKEQAKQEKSAVSEQLEQTDKAS